MKTKIMSIIALLAVGFLTSIAAAKEPSDFIKRPTAEQILLYSDALAKAPSADRKAATDALQKWMDGSLTNQEAAKYKDMLKLTPENTSIKPMGSTEACLACIASCCFWWGCNVACEAACAVGACK
ncbi:hypothetical protein ACFOJE_20365 [Azotobacter bryophylli]|uniref:Uncharacterized protein n=1 Tax=Azotobacter bryophylli TaxID=1986537 RepID=A0ABV7AZU9_9GAMM